MPDPFTNVINQDGINIKVDVPPLTIFAIVGGIFIAVVLGGVVTHLLVKAIDK